jgi:hypothetical protein
MFLPEKKLSIEVTQIDRIKIDNVYLAEARENEVLEKLTSNASSPDHQYTGLQILVSFMAGV